ncbi:MAG: Gfo/Idh/MocA family oxidoreductase [bacterium]|nr:Gfo/Idh/MocA family oxidoreductase [bacterium]
MTALRLGVIGGGHLGRIHAKLAKSNDQFELVAVADPSPESCRVCEEQFALETTHDYRELMDSIDAAVVASPTVSHYEVTSQLLRAGVHCLVEKPLATTPDQAQRLVQIANSHACVLQVGHVERFNPIWTTAQNSLGTPKFIEATRAGVYSGRSTDIGVVMDLMIHDLDLILSVEHSPVRDIRASGIALLGSHEDIAEARIEFESGCIANLRASRVATGPVRHMRIYSSSGLSDLDFSSDKVRFVRPSNQVVARAAALDELSVADRMQAKQRIFEDLLQGEELPVPARNAILDEHNDFALSIRTGCAPSVTGADGARAVEVAARIVECVNHHAWDGEHSRAWRIGALATEEPRILPMPSERAGMHPTRRAG